MGGEGEVTKKKIQTPNQNKQKIIIKNKQNCLLQNFEVIQKLSHICMKENNTGYI